MADAVLLVAGVVLGLGSSLVAATVQERFQRQRIALQRATSAEGAAMVELQDLLPQISQNMLSLIHRAGSAIDQMGDIDPDDLYNDVMANAQPWWRAWALMTRLRDGATRALVTDAIEKAWPYGLVELQQFLASNRSEGYDLQGAWDATHRAILALGADLRRVDGGSRQDSGPVTKRTTRWIGNVREWRFRH